MANRRRLPAEQHTVAVTTTSILLVPYSPTRVALTLSSPVSNTVRVTLRRDATATDGISLGVQTNAITWTYDTGGEWVQGPLFAIATVGTERIGVIEVHDPGGQ